MELEDFYKTLNESQRETFDYSLNDLFNFLKKQFLVKNEINTFKTNLRIGFKFYANVEITYFVNSSKEFSAQVTKVTPVTNSDQFLDSLINNNE